MYTDSIDSGAVDGAHEIVMQHQMARGTTVAAMVAKGDNDDACIVLRDALRKRTRKVRGSGTELSDVEARAAPNQEAAVLSCTKAGWQPMARLVVTKVREVS